MPLFASTTCGTPGYIAPEILTDKKYKQHCDYWSIGVLCYLLLSGSLPFYASDTMAMFALIKKCKWDMSDQAWENVSDEAKDFVKKLLIKEPEKRMNCDQALEHPWLRENKAASTKNLFGGMKKEGDDKGEGQPGEMDENMDSMHASFVDFNLDPFPDAFQARVKGEFEAAMSEESRKEEEFIALENCVEVSRSNIS